MGILVGDLNCCVKSTLNDYDNLHHRQVNKFYDILQDSIFTNELRR